MTWTYDVSDLGSSPKDQVRLLIGDTYSADPQMQDEEILFYLTTRSSAYGAAAECCRTLQARFSRSVDMTAGDTKAMYSQMAKAYSVKAIELETKAALVGSGTPYAGGLTITDLTNNQQNTDRLPTQFNIGMTDSVLPVPSVGNEPDQAAEQVVGIEP